MCEGYIRSGEAELYYREIGSGPAVIVLHGGPDFDHRYLLPDLDRLATVCRLIYYDQRGRGASRWSFRPDEVRIETEADDVDVVRAHFDLQRVAVLGHSWGAHLALHYALRHPGRLSHLILLNPAPASHADSELMGQLRRAKRAPRAEEMERIAASDAFQRGEPEAVAAYYRLDFGSTFVHPEDVNRLDLHWTREQTLRGRDIEDQLMPQVYGREGYDLVPELARIRVPTMVIHGDHDFVPLEASARIANAIPGARLCVLRDSGHFSYVDAGDEMRDAVVSLLGRMY